MLWLTFSSRLFIRDRVLLAKTGLRKFSARFPEAGDGVASVLRATAGMVGQAAEFLPYSLLRLESYSAEQPRSDSLSSSSIVFPFEQFRMLIDVDFYGVKLIYKEPFESLLILGRITLDPVSLSEVYSDLMAKCAQLRVVWKALGDAHQKPPR